LLYQTYLNCIENALELEYSATASDFDIVGDYSKSDAVEEYSNLDAVSMQFNMARYSESRYPSQYLTY
jgi:hypothetical protein